eukprot:10018640-Lingulodinium_polyedra.AAC.1
MAPTGSECQAPVRRRSSPAPCMPAALVGRLIRSAHGSGRRQAPPASRIQAIGRMHGGSMPGGKSP